MSKQLTLKDLKQMVDYAIEKGGENARIVVAQKDQLGDTWFLPLYPEDIALNEKQFIIKT